MSIASPPPPVPATKSSLPLELLRLAWPTVISRAGILVMAMVDVIMVGRYGTDELAYASLGNALFIALLVTGVGLMIGVVALTAQRAGAGRERECGTIWRDSLPWAGLVGGIAMLVCFCGEAVFLAFGQKPEMAREAGIVASLLAPGLLGYGFFVVSTFFLEGIRRPAPGMIAMMAANVLNFALNWLFIYGNLGAPEMGAAGSAMTTAIVRCFLGVALVIYILRLPDAARFGLDRPMRFGGWWQRGRMQRRIGYGAGVSIGLETCAHATLMQFAGLHGAVPVAAYSIAHNIEATMFMAALGLGGATGVLVAGAWAREDASGARAAARTGLAGGLIAMMMIGGAVLLLREEIAAVYSTDAAVRRAALPVIAIAMLAVLADAGQMITGQSVRAIGDVWPSTLRYAIAYWGVMVPLAWLLAIEMGLGAPALMASVGIGCALSLGLQYRRLQTLLAGIDGP